MEKLEFKDEPCQRFFASLGMLVQVGVPLRKALPIIREEITEISADITKIYQKMETGNSFFESIKICPSLFPAPIPAMIRLAEKGSLFESVFLLLAEKFRTGVFTRDKEKGVSTNASLAVNLMDWFQYLTLSLQAGIPFNQTLSLCSEIVINQKLHSILNSFANEFQKRPHLNLILEKHPSYFPHPIPAMIKMGEGIGAPDSFMNTIHEGFKSGRFKEENGKIISSGLPVKEKISDLLSTIYHGINLGFSIPQSLAYAKDLLEDEKLEKIINGLSDSLSDNHSLSTALASYPDYFPPYIREPVRLCEEKGQEKVNFVLYWLGRCFDTGLLGYDASEMDESLEIYRFFVFIVMYRDIGCSLPETFAKATLGIKSHKLSKTLQKVSLSVSKGRGITASIKLHSDIFPPHIIALIKIGEEKGMLSEIMTSIAHRLLTWDYHSEDKNKKNIEPIKKSRQNAIIYFFKLFSILLKENIDPVEIFRIISGEIDEPGVSPFLKSAAEKTSAGEKWTSVFEDYPDLFSSETVQLLKIGKNDYAYPVLLFIIEEYERGAILLADNDLNEHHSSSENLLIRFLFGFQIALRSYPTPLEVLKHSLPLLTHKNYHDLKKSLLNSIEKGNTFFEAFSQHPDFFSKSITIMMREGENRNSLPDTTLMVVNGLRKGFL